MRLYAVRQVWDALTGDELFELKHRKIVRAADWSADSAHIVTGGKEGVLRLYDVSRPEAEPSMLEGHAPNSLIKVPPRRPPRSHRPRGGSCRRVSGGPTVRAAPLTGTRSVASREGRA